MTHRILNEWSLDFRAGSVLYSATGAVLSWMAEWHYSTTYYFSQLTVWSGVRVKELRPNDKPVFIRALHRYAASAPSSVWPCIPEALHSASRAKALRSPRKRRSIPRQVGALGPSGTVDHDRSNLSICHAVSGPHRALLCCFAAVPLQPN